MNAKFKVMKDAYGRRGVYRAIRSNVPGSVTGWEWFADEKDFAELRGVLDVIPE